MTLLQRIRRLFGPVVKWDKSEELLQVERSIARGKARTRRKQAARKRSKR